MLHCVDRIGGIWRIPEFAAQHANQLVAVDAADDVEMHRAGCSPHRVDDGSSGGVRCEPSDGEHVRPA